MEHGLGMISAGFPFLSRLRYEDTDVPTFWLLVCVVQYISKSCITFRTLNDGNYGLFLIMGTPEFMSSTVSR